MIGGQDRGLPAGHVVGPGEDLPLEFEEEHPQKLAGFAQQMV